MTRPHELTPEAVGRLTVATEPWLSCDDCFDDIDRVVEDLLTGAAPMDPGFRVHLGACSVCREEASSLVSLVAPDHGLDPKAALALLESVLYRA
jgi:hypothetical protein